MTISIENQSRAQIAEFLPDAIAKAMTSYRLYMEQEEGKEVSFKEKHTACKAAIAHLELLLKLARWADLPDGAAMAQNDQMVLAAVLAAAESELEGHGEGQDSAEP